MTFQVMVNHDPNCAVEAKKHLEKCKFRVTNIFESGIVVAKTGEQILDMYALECEGTRLNYALYKLIGGLTELDNHGVKTLVRVTQ